MAVLEKQTINDRLEWSERSQGIAHARLEVDFNQWLLEQASALREHHHQSLDWSNLAEELEAMARKDRNELRSHLQNLVSHLLKWAYQPNRRSKSSQATINSARDQIDDKLEESPSLKSELDKLWSEPKLYVRAVRDARLDTEDQVEFPRQPPWTLSQILDAEFFPE